MQLVQTVAPTSEPLTLEEIKLFLRVIDNEDDVLISTLIIAVREHVENITNRQLVTATFELYDDDFTVRMPKSPIQAITKIEYMDSDNAYLVLDASEYYLYEKNGVGYIKYKNIPVVPEHKKAVKITFTAGYINVPEAIKSYMKVKISTLYENREEFVIGASIAEFGNKFVESLLSPYIVRNT